MSGPRRTRENTVQKDFEPTSVDPGGIPVGSPTGMLRSLLQRLGFGSLGVRDHQTALYSRQGLLARGDRLVARSGRGAALVIFDFHDLLEVRGIYGADISATLQRALVEQLLRLAGRHGLAARTGPAQFAVLLPGTRHREAVAATLRVFGKPCRLELDLPDDELVLVPEVTVDTCDAEPGSVRELYESLSIRLARHRDLEERRRSYLRRSRERHSRPSPLEPAGDEGLREFALP
jgi:GGDEF domain-containing protein